MATDNFMKQAEDSGLSIARMESESDLVGNEEAQAIIIESGNEELFLKIAKSLNDIQQRVVFVKNMEALKENTVRKCLEFENVILSGDIDKCDLKDDILKKSYNTTVVFDQPQVEMSFKVPELEKYTGYLWGKDVEGVVRIVMK